MYKTGVSRIQVKARVGKRKISTILFPRCTSKHYSYLRIFEYDFEAKKSEEVKVEGIPFKDVGWRSVQVDDHLFITGGDKEPKRCLVYVRTNDNVFRKVTGSRDMLIPRSKHSVCTDG